MRRFWPPADAAQADYERLRAAVLDGTPLIARPVADAVFVATARGAPRPPWTPHADPRLAALAGGYALVLAAVEQSVHEAGEVAR